MTTAENTISPEDLNEIDENEDFQHGDKLNPFPELPPGDIKLILHATRNFYAHKSRKFDYYLQTAQHAFTPMDEATVKKELFRVPGITRDKCKRKNGTQTELSLADYCILYINKHKTVKHAYNLISGHRAGVDMDKRILYANELDLIPPAPGSWETIKAAIKSILTEPGKIQNPDESALVSGRQYAYFLAWCAHAVKTLYAWQYDPGALLALIGQAAAGKTFLLNKIIAPLLATPFPASCAGYLAEGKFNSEWAPCALLTADDQGVIVKAAIRRQASENLKALLAPGAKSITGKGVDTYQDFIFWRFVVCANTTNLDGLILEVNSSTDDKIAALYCSRMDIPGYPNTSPDEKQALDETIARELPAFIHYLLNDYTNPIPAARYGAPVYRHPDLDDALRRSSSATETLDFIASVLIDSCSDSATFRDDIITEQTAGYIRKFIQDIINNKELKVKYPYGWGTNPRVLKSTLERICEEQPQYVSCKYDTHKKTNVFTINFGALRTLYI